MIPAAERLPDIDRLIERGRYFVLHGPRQSGKTTTVHACIDRINAGGRHFALYCSLEKLEVFAEFGPAMEGIQNKIKQALRESEVAELREACRHLPGFSASRATELQPLVNEAWTAPPVLSLTTIDAVDGTLKALCARLNKGLVIFFDEADCLTGEASIFFLRQLRDGYSTRRKVPYPSSIALVGMRKIRDYRSSVRQDSESMGKSSPFNIITKSLTISDFTLNEVKDLYAQHTLATGQEFLEGTAERVMYWSNGQPWLVNALAWEATEELLDEDWSRPVTPEVIDDAAEVLKLDGNVHIDSLVNRLHEPPVQRIMEAVLSGSRIFGLKLADDRRYCIEIGLIKSSVGGAFMPANLIYADVIVRTLTEEYQAELPDELVGRFVGQDGPDVSGLLKEFQAFWVGNSADMSNRFSYRECDAQLALFGYMQKAYNGKVQTIKQFRTGTGIADICAVSSGREFPIELKIRTRHYSERVSIEQLMRYMDSCLAREGWLVVFDRDQGKPWAEKLTWETKDMPNGRKVHVVGC
jgi:hypothetical protein